MSDFFRLRGQPKQNHRVVNSGPIRLKSEEKRVVERILDRAFQRPKG